MSDVPIPITSLTNKDIRVLLTETFSEFKIQQHEQTWKGFFMQFALSAFSFAACAYLLGPVFNSLKNDSTTSERKKNDEAKKYLRDCARASGRMTFPELGTFEEALLADVIFPHQIPVTFDDIGGMNGLKSSIYETVILPLQCPQLFAAMRVSHTSSSSSNDESSEDQHQSYSGSSLLSPPKGVLFYGPPGTGKTMMAKAIAKHCSATFLNIKLSSMQTKWYGDSQKLARAIFTLAHKLAPSIIFIDEIDLVMRNRSSEDHEATSGVKAEFMTMWDGLTTSNAGVTVLGASNRPWDIDDAILRRMPSQFLVNLPDQVEREAILRVLLRDLRLAEDVNLVELASITNGYSGSDLNEVCREAALLPVRELIHLRSNTVSVEAIESFNTDEILHKTPRAVSQADFMTALSHIQPTGQASMAYMTAFQHAHTSRGSK